MTLTDNIKETPQKEINAQNIMEYKVAKINANQKIKTVMRFITTNQNYPIRDLVNKFNLDWALLKDFNNGAAKVGFYTDESQRFLVLEMHLPMNQWFR